MSHWTYDVNFFESSSPRKYFLNPRECLRIKYWSCLQHCRQKAPRLHSAGQNDTERKDSAYESQGYFRPVFLIVQYRSIPIIFVRVYRGGVCIRNRNYNFSSYKKRLRFQFLKIDKILRPVSRKQSLCLLIFPTEESDVLIFGNAIFANEQKCTCELPRPQATGLILCLCLYVRQTLGQDLSDLRHFVFNIMSLLVSPSG